MSKNLGKPSGMDEEDLIRAIQDTEKNGKESDYYSLICDCVREQVVEGCYHTTGEPSNTVDCYRCHGRIALEGECAALKPFSKMEDIPRDRYHWDPEILCPSCAEDESVNEEFQLGFLMHGELSKRRSRPGDPAPAPYIYYVSLDEAVEAEIITNCPNDGGFQCW